MKLITGTYPLGSVKICELGFSKMSFTTVSTTSSSENLPCSVTADSTRSFENDTTTANRDSVKIAIEASAVDISTNGIKDSTKSSQRTYSRDKTERSEVLLCNKY